jgi:peptide chain release factor subunit 1
MQSDRFRPLLATPGPFASVFFADTEDADDAAAQARRQWPALREQLKCQGADDAVVAEIEYAVTELDPPIRRGGRAVVAGATGVVLNEYLLRPATEPVVRVSELPYIVPILEHGFEHSNYLLVVVDPRGALITIHKVIRRSETVEGSDCRAPLGPAAQTPASDAVSRCAIADRISDLVDDWSLEAIFLVGDEELRARLLAALPQRLRDRAISLPVGAGRGGYDFEEIQQAVDITLLRRRLSLIDNATERFTAEINRNSGLAAEGLGAVCTALQQGAVDTMIIGDIDDATVVADEAMTTVAPNADVLSERGAAPAKTLRADEALPLLAISGGASLVRTDERITPADGIGAVLRYGPTLH